MKRKAGSYCLILALGAVSGLVVPDGLSALVFPVTKTADTNDGTCDADCSLREAIVAANAAVGLDTISFAIPGAGPHTIAPTSQFPDITSPVVIDGYTQTGSSVNSNVTGGLNTVLMIELNGNGAGVNSEGLRISAGGSTVRGLVINLFLGNGIELFGGATAGGNTIAGNFIGTNVAGTSSPGGIGDNGVYVNGSPNNVIGGTTPAARNLISGHGEDGVDIDGIFSNANVIQGNLIGVDITGNNDLANADGIDMENGASGTQIGGPTPAERNVISGNSESGIEAGGAGTVNIVIQGNYIGTNAAGTLSVQNIDGISLSTFGNTIGGAAPGEGNLISGNEGHGILLEDIGNVVEGNLIGTDASGTAPIPNIGDGIRLDGKSAALNTIGGTAAGAGNTIAFNDGRGVGHSGDNGNSIRGNRIFSNDDLGIDLGGSDGVTPNDAGDLDSGPNLLQNFPVLTSASSGGGTTTIQGNLNSTPVTIFNVDFYANAACDPSGNGEGQTYLGASSVTTDAAGNATINVVLPVTVGAGQLITATASAPAVLELARSGLSGAPANTSEFSACVALAGVGATATPTQTPTVTTTPTITLTPTVTAGGPGGGPSATDIPTLTPMTLALLAFGLAAIGWLVLRRVS